MQTIQGQVVDPQGNPVSEAAVYIVASPVSMPDMGLLTDASGNFTLGAPAAGSYTIGARADPWNASQSKVEVQDGMSAIVKIQLTTV